jgi:hypothetical protein
MVLKDDSILSPFVIRAWELIYLFRDFNFGHFGSSNLCWSKKVTSDVIHHLSNSKHIF